MALGALCFGTLAASAAEKVAVVGTAEAASIIRNLSETESGSVDFEEFREGLPASEFSNYALVILTPGTDNAPTLSYSPADCAVIEEYVAKGGRLLLIQQAPKLLRLTEGDSDKGSDYLYGRSYYHRDGVACEVMVPEDPLLKGVLDANPAPHWFHASVLLAHDAFQNIIGGNGQILVGRAKFGDGAVYYVGHELFRMQLPSRLERHADADSWKHLLLNIIQEKP